MNFNKNETELNMENPTHRFRKTNLVLQLMYESQIKSKMYSVLNELSEYTYFYISKTLLHTFFCLFLKPLKAFSVSLTFTTQKANACSPWISCSC